MENKINYNEKLKIIINNIDNTNKPNLFMHICCGPCSTYVLEKLNKYFNIYVVFYNPNIDTKEEFDKRLMNFKKVIDINKYDIKILYEDYNHNEFIDYVKGFENEPERGKRCEKCITLRLIKTYEIAKKYIVEHSLKDKQNYLCTSLSISPHKNAIMIENIGEKLCENDDYLSYLPSDFKKENGYLRSIELSKQYNLYRQEYCGCEFAKNFTLKI